jgi:hypothetical protein
MAVYSIIVGVALAYPPRVHEYRKIMVEAPNVREAKLVAAQMAACSSTMPVSTELVVNDRDPEFERILGEILTEHDETLRRLVD